MRILSLLAAILCIVMPAAAQEVPAPADKPGWSLVIHGGAGVIRRDRLDPDKEAEIRAALDRALTAGSAVLEAGGDAIDAVQAAITVLEDDPNFNAGKGAVFTYEGTNELDSSIMDGRDRSAGAVAGVHFTRHPILLARKVMTDSPHVMLSGDGADRFSKDMGLEQVDPEYFRTENRWRQLQDLKAREGADETAAGAFEADHKYGTVGAVALDSNGNVAAGTSTGGIVGKRYGRIGDSPIIGAGTYADNRSCAISATGAGEYFIQVGVAQEICTRLRIEAAARGAAQGPPMSAADVQAVADAVIAEMGEMGGSGGIIYLTPWGHKGYSFDTRGMYRGMAGSDGTKSVAIFDDEE